MSLPVTRKPFLALFLSFIMPGLGQVYSGQLIRGGCLAVFFCIIPLMITRLTVTLPDVFMLTGIGSAALTALFIYAYSLFDSYRLAARNKETFQRQPYNNFFFYCAAWLLGIALMVSCDGYLKTNIVEAYRIVGTSMEPTVLRGDYVLADKTAYQKQSVSKGDIVIVVYPDDRSKVLIRQIYALPGDQITRQNGASLTVPHGSVIIKGTGNQKSADSDTFGPLDMRDIVGKVVQVYFSKGENSIRWNRIGNLVNSSQTR